MKNPHIGSTFESFLQEEGLQEDIDVLAQKRVIAWQIERAMEEGGINKVEMAARMNTSRTQVDRLLDPENNKVQLDTLQRAAKAVGRALKVELIPPLGGVCLPADAAAVPGRRVERSRGAGAVRPALSPHSRRPR